MSPTRIFAELTQPEIAAQFKRNPLILRPAGSVEQHGAHLPTGTDLYAANSVSHAVAERMSGSKLKRPATPASDADVKFAADLAGAVTRALEKAGDGQRERQSAASRVFRVWRSDEAERRVRDIALRGYEAGLEASRKVEALS